MSPRPTSARAVTTALATTVALALCASPLAAQWRVEGSAVVGRMEHRVDAGFGVATSTGTTLGAAALVGYGNAIEVEGEATGGTLAADAVARDDRTLGEVNARVSVLPFPWLAVHAAGTVRSYDLALARQRWTEAGLGAELRMAFASGQVRGIVRGTLYPHVAVSGLPSPDLGVASAAGIHADLGRITGAVEYTVERYAFGSDAGETARHEQLAGLRVRIGARW